MGSSSKPSTRVPSAVDVGRNDRRTLILAAALIAGVIIVGVIAIAVSVGDGPRRDTNNQLAEAGGGKPHIIPRINDGAPPKKPGDRGGWEQLAIFGLMASALAGIGFAIFRGGKTARANRGMWFDAAATGQDGALDRDGRPAYLDDHAATGSGAEAGPDPSTSTSTSTESHAETPQT